MPNREQRRFPASSPVIIPGYASSESSSSQSDLSLLVCGTDPIVSIPASPTMDHNMSNAALSSPKEQLVYPLKHISPAEEAAAMQEIQRILSLETLLIVEQLFTDLLQVQKRNQQKQEIQRILSWETLLIVEQLFTDLLQVQQRNQQMQEIQRILSWEMLLIVEQLFTDLLKVQQRKQQMQEIQRILRFETLLIFEQLFTYLLQVHQRKQ